MFRDGLSRCENWASGTESTSHNTVDTKRSAASGYQGRVLR
jgi:hypothetical protein